MEDEVVMKRAGRSWLDPNDEGNTETCAWEVEVEAFASGAAILASVNVGLGCGESSCSSLSWCEDETEFRAHRLRVCRLREELRRYVQALDEAWKKHEEHATASPPEGEGE